MSVLYLRAASDLPVRVMHCEHTLLVVVHHDLVGRYLGRWPARLCVVLLRDDAGAHAAIDRGQHSSADSKSEWR